MKIDWQQLSPGERDTALKHYILHNKLNSVVTAQKICEEMSRTHFLFCDQTGGGPPVFRFVAGKGKTAGLAVSDDVAEGIYKAALRTVGVEVTDPAESAPPALHPRAMTRHASRARAH